MKPTFSPYLAITYICLHDIIGPWSTYTLYNLCFLIFVILGVKNAKIIFWPIFDLNQMKLNWKILSALAIFTVISRFAGHAFLAPETEALSIKSLAELTVPAFVEEPISRALIFACLYRGLADKPQILILLMTLVDLDLHHPRSLLQAFFVFQFSTTSSIIYLYSRSIGMCVIAHLFWNLVCFVP